MDEWYKRTLEAGLSEAKECGDWDAAASATASARREDEDGRGRGTSESLRRRVSVCLRGTMQDDDARFDVEHGRDEQCVGCGRVFEFR